MEPPALLINNYGSGHGLSAVVYHALRNFLIMGFSTSDDKIAFLKFRFILDLILWQLMLINLLKKEMEFQKSDFTVWTFKMCKNFGSGFQMKVLRFTLHSTQCNAQVSAYRTEKTELAILLVNKITYQVIYDSETIDKVIRWWKTLLNLSRKMRE